MPVTDKLNEFEKKLESAIKTAFEKSLDEYDEFEISVDYDTHARINDVVKGLDLEVYGMSVTPSEFTITFEFCRSFHNITKRNFPKHCYIRLENDGNYYLTLNKKNLERNWYLGITDISFNLKTVPENEMKDCLKQFDDNLLLKVLSN